jgi:hypothetical protein
MSKKAGEANRPNETSHWYYKESSFFHAVEIRSAWDVEDSICPAPKNFYAKNDLSLVKTVPRSRRKFGPLDEQDDGHFPQLGNLLCAHACVRAHACVWECVF